MDKRELLKNRSVVSTTEDVQLDAELVVTVRALTREEVKRCSYGDVDESQFTSQKDIDKFVKKLDRRRVENRMIATALVDPAMTEEDVEKWLDNAPSGDSVRVMEAVSRISGMSEGYPKSGLQKVRSKS